MNYRRNKQSACVYVVSETFSEWHKIGMTTQIPTKRLRSFQTGNHRSLFYRCRTPFIPFETASNLEEALLRTFSSTYRNYKDQSTYEKYTRQNPHSISGGKEWFEYPANKLEIIFYKICKELLSTTSICASEVFASKNQIYMWNGHDKHIKELAA